MSSTGRGYQAWNNDEGRRHLNSISSNNIPVVEDIDENATDSDWDDSDAESNAGPFGLPNQNPPNIDSVNIQNAENTMFGNRAIYNGPVTIKQFVSANEYDKKWEKSVKSTPTKGDINLCFKTDKFQQSRKNFLDSKFYTHFGKLIERWELMNRKEKYITISVVFTLFLTLILTLILVLVKAGGESDSVYNSVRMVSRSQWNALPPRPDTTELELPSTRVIIAHTATPSCTNESDCASRVLAIQKGHMQEFKYADIGYNFLIGGDGAAYMGRGWDIQGAHTRAHNSKSICIAFIGRYDQEPPAKHLLDAAQNLIKLGVHLNKLNDDYKLYSQMQLRDSEVPETALYEIVKKWEHWTETETSN